MGLIIVFFISYMVFNRTSKTTKNKNPKASWVYVERLNCIALFYPPFVLAYMMVFYPPFVVDGLEHMFSRK